MILGVLGLLGCHGPRDSSDTAPDETTLLLTEANGLTFDADLTIPAYPADPAEDVAISWEALSLGVLGLGIAPVTQVQLTGFLGVDEDAVQEALLAGTITSASIWIQFGCTPEATVCRFSDFQVFGHDFPVSDYFGTEEGTWLVTLWGADASGVQGLLFLDPGSGDTVTYGDPGATLLPSSVVGAVTPLVVTSNTDVELDWSTLALDPRGQTVDARRIDTAVLLHLGTPPEDIAGVLGATGLGTADAIPIDVSSSSALHLSEFGQPIDSDGTWLIALLSSSSWVPVPAFLGVITVD